MRTFTKKIMWLLVLLILTVGNAFAQPKQNPVEPGSKGALPALPTFVPLGNNQFVGLELIFANKDRADFQWPSLADLGGAESCRIQYRNHDGGEWTDGEIQIVEGNKGLVTSQNLNFDVTDFQVVLQGGTMDGYTSNIVTVTRSSMSSLPDQISSSDYANTLIVGNTVYFNSIYNYFNIKTYKEDDTEVACTLEDGYYKYQWYRRDPTSYEMTKIENATEYSYTPTNDDIGYQLVAGVSGDEEHCSFSYYANFGVVNMPILASIDKIYVDGIILNTEYVLSDPQNEILFAGGWDMDKENAKKLEIEELEPGQYAIRIDTRSFEQGGFIYAKEGYSLCFLYGNGEEEQWYEPARLMLWEVGGEFEVKPYLEGKSVPADIEVIGKSMDGKDIVVDSYSFRDVNGGAGEDGGIDENTENGGVEGDGKEGAGGKTRRRTRGDYVEGEYVAYFYNIYEGTCRVRTLMTDEALQTYYANSVTWTDATPIEVKRPDREKMKEEDFENYPPSYTIDMVPKPANLEGSGDIFGSLDYESEDNMYAYLKNKDGKVVAFTPLEAGTFRFQNVPYGEYQVLLEVTGLKMPDVQTVTISETQTTVANLDYTVDGSEIMMKGNALILSVLDKDNNPVSGEYDVVWYNADQEAIGGGKSLRGLEDGTQVFFSVLPGKELSESYRDLLMQSTTFKDGTVNCQLEPMTMVTLEGSVSAMGIDDNPASVTVMQMLNGRWEKAWDPIKTDKGLFAMRVYDDQTTVTVTRADCADATIQRDRLGETGNVGTIPLSLLDGVYFTVDLTYKTAVKPTDASETLAVPGGLGDFEVFIKNGGTDVTDFVVQNSSILIMSGAAAGNTLSLTLKSKQGLYADATGTFTVSGGTDNVLLEATELGGIYATATSWNPADVGYVYDANGNLAARVAYAGEELNVAHLPAGNYTLVSMMKSQMLGNAQTLATLTSIGLKNTDYVSTSVTIADGKISMLEVGEIPSFDENAISCVTENSYFNADKTSTYVGSYLTFTSHIDLKDNLDLSLNNMALLVDLPEGCAMEGTNAVVGRENVKFTQSGNRVTIPLTAENYANKIRFCAAPQAEKSMTLTSYVKIGETLLQPIGSVQFSVKGFPISAPLKASTQKITVSGTAPAPGEIKVYDGDVVIGTANAGWKGQEWKAECTLQKAFDNTYHTIYAKLNTGETELSSETKSVEYDPNVIAPAKSTMIYYNREFAKTYNIEFNYSDGTTSDSYYYFYPFLYDDWWARQDKEEKSFTFVADFTVNDPEKIKNIDFKVLASDGTVRTLPGTFDNTKQAWVATSKYNSNRLPVNVALDYDMLVSSGTNHEAGLTDQGNSLVNLSSQIAQFLQSKVTAIKTAEDAKSLTFNLNVFIGGIPIPFQGKIEEIDYATAQQLMSTQQFNYVAAANGTVASYAEWDNTGVKATFCDLGQQYAVKAALTMKDNLEWTIDKNYFTIDNLSKLFSNEGFITVLGEYGYNLISITGAKDLFNVRKDFENMNSIAINYTANYEALSAVLKSALNAKCADGSKRLTSQQIATYTDEIAAIDSRGAAFIETFNEFLKAYQQKMLENVVANASSSVVSLAINTIEGLTQFQTAKAKQLMLALLNSAVSGELTTTILSNALGVAMKNIETKASKVYSAEEFKSVKDYVLKWSADEHLAILNKYADLKKDIRDHYGRCDNLVNIDEFIRDDGMFTTPSTEPILDPSGYVYEGVLSNRLPGVTTTVYYKDETGAPKKWNAEDYGQDNPLTTDENGFYQWNVPNGEWQVKYEKEGYETVTSEWLPVPPPQLDVNQGMKSATPPTVTSLKGYEGGIVIDMSKYMTASTFNTTNVTVTRNGAAQAGKVELDDPEGASQSDGKLASKFRFVPETDFIASDAVVVTVHKEVQSYCGVEMAEDYQATVPIEGEVKKIVYDENLTVEHQGTKKITVSVLPKEASVGKKLNVKTSSADIVSLEAAQADIDEDGKASVTVTGELLGDAYITFEVAGTDVSETTKVTVVEGAIIENESIKISSAKQVTYMSDKDLDFTGYPDLKAYVATGYAKSGTIWLTRVKQVPANTGFLLMGDEGDYEIPVSESTSDCYYKNLFKGTLEGTTIQTTEDGYTNYYLSKGDYGVSFYKVGASGVKLGTNRAYLSVPSDIPAVGTAGGTETIKVSAALQVPYYSANSLDFTDMESKGLKAYTATGYDYEKGTIWLSRVKQVPAETGILIMADKAGDYDVPKASVASVYENMFMGTLGGKTIQTEETIAGEDYINYYLSKGDYGISFYKVGASGVTLGENRCYLAVPVRKSSASGTRSFSSEADQITIQESDEVIGIPLYRGIGGDDDGTTSIREMKSGEVKGEEWFTLQGQRVAKPGKGIYIRNGRKVVIK